MLNVLWNSIKISSLWISCTWIPFEIYFHRAYSWHIIPKGASATQISIEKFNGTLTQSQTPKKTNDSRVRDDDANRLPKMIIFDYAEFERSGEKTIYIYFDICMHCQYTGDDLVLHLWNRWMNESFVTFPFKPKRFTYNYSWSAHFVCRKWQIHWLIESRIKCEMNVT